MELRFSISNLGTRVPIFCMKDPRKNLAMIDA